MASIFIYGGVNMLRHLEGHTQAAKPLLEKAAGGENKLPADAETLVKVDAAVKVVAGTTFALGKFPRLSALALFGSLVPTTAAGHPFWEAKDDEKQQQLIHFLKNVGIGGGLLIAAADTEGRPSVGWRTRRAAKKASKQVADTAGAAREALPV